MDSNDKLMRLEEVAAYLGISYTAARVLILYDNVMPHVTVGARGKRVKESELKAYLKRLEEGKKHGDDTGNSGSTGHIDTRRPFKGR